MVRRFWPTVIQDSKDLNLKIWEVFSQIPFLNHAEEIICFSQHFEELVQNCPEDVMFAGEKRTMLVSTVLLRADWPLWIPMWLTQKINQCFLQCSDSKTLHCRESNWRLIWHWRRECLKWVEILQLNRNCDRMSERDFTLIFEKRRVFFKWIVWRKTWYVLIVRGDTREMKQHVGLNWSRKSTSVAREKVYQCERKFTNAKGDANKY